jgi:hypothetical protein
VEGLGGISAVGGVEEAYISAYLSLSCLAHPAKWEKEVAFTVEARIG